MQTYMAARVFVWTNGIVVVVKVVFFYCRRPPHFSDAASTLDEIRQTLSDSRTHFSNAVILRAPWPKIADSNLISHIN